MLEINWDYDITIEGIVDTGIIVVSHFDNPIQDKMLNFVSAAFVGNPRVLFPITSFVGAYHILTAYLKVDRYEAKQALESTLNLDSDYFFPYIDRKLGIKAFDIASVYRIESWDGYLCALADLFKTKNLYTIDRKLQKLKKYNIISPVTDRDLHQYYTFLQETVFSA